MEVTLPVLYVAKTKQYFVGVKQLDLTLKGQLIHVTLPNISPSNS